MFCPKCGSRNEDNVYHCANCGSPVRPAPAANVPPYGGTPAANVPPYGAPPVEGGVYSSASGMPKPNNWLIPAIVVTALSFLGCSCLPLGVVAIIFAAMVDGKYTSGDYAGAQNFAGKAKLFTILAIVIGVICNGALFAFWFLGMAASVGAGGGF